MHYEIHAHSENTKYINTFRENVSLCDSLHINSKLSVGVKTIQTAIQLAVQSVQIKEWRKNERREKRLKKRKEEKIRKLRRRRSVPEPK